MTIRLSSREHSVLCAITDWKAPFEVVNMLFPSGHCSERDRNDTAKALRSVARRGLAEYGAPNGTYKITEEGKLALIGKEPPRDIPVIFSAPMVEALWSGRKTMTRRLALRSCELCGNKAGTCRGPHKPSPWQRVKPGDLLWVRENWAETSIAPIVSTIDNPVVVYAAVDNRTDYGGPWRPSIHMPRRASRITLEVKETKIERLQDISEQDALAEGIVEYQDGFHWEPNPRPAYVRFVGKTARQAFLGLWELLHGAESASSNPEVVAPTFTVHQQNIDVFKKARAA